jgi:tubulin polyglutamylase TTLL4
MNIDVNALFSNIEDVIIKTCISVEPFMTNSINKLPDHRNNCFEIYGFDILIDDNLKPWLLECNVCPSLSSSSPLDKRIKTSLISDTL